MQVIVTGYSTHDTIILHLIFDRNPAFHVDKPRFMLKYKVMRTEEFENIVKYKSSKGWYKLISKIKYFTLKVAKLDPQPSSRQPT